MSNHPDMAKVLFRVAEDDGSANVETLWATPLGDDRYQLDNSPFYAYAVSWKDVIYAPRDPDEQLPTFERVISKSGHKTIRIVFESPAIEGSESLDLLQLLVSLGCSYEGANKRYICIDVPPEVDLETVRQFAIQHALQFEHADPTYSELFPNEPE